MNGGQIIRLPAQARATSAPAGHGFDLYRSCFEYSLDAVLLTAPDGTVTAANPAACALFGCTEADLCAAGRFGLIDPASPELGPMLDERARTGQARAELTFVRADGSRFRATISSARFVDGGGRPRIVMIIHDLTDRHLARDALVESQALLDAIVNGTQDVIFSVGAEHFELLSFNAGLAAYFERSFGRGAAIGMRPEEAFPTAELADTWKGFFRTALEIGRHVAEYRTLTGDTILELTFNRLDCNGIPFGIAAFGHDVTEVRHATHRLRASEQKYRSVVSSMVEGVALQAADGRILEVNRAAELIGGRTLDELRGQAPDDPRWDTVHEDGTPFPRSEHPAAVTLRTGIAQMNVVMGIRRPDGERRWLRINSAPLERAEGPDPAAVVTTFHDITDYKAAQRQVVDYADRLERAMQQTLQAVSHMIELKDPYTAGHQRRVGNLAAAIAAELGWSAPRCRQLRAIGLVHDAGKIALPSDLLAKPSRLSPLEHAMIQTHVEHGYEILKHVEFDQPIAEIVRQHHERLDGSGYPLGLKGEAIRIEARILAVADVIESMASHRPYRPALGLEAAFTEIRRGRGTLYDPEVVDALFRLITRRGESTAVDAAFDDA